MLRHWHFDGQQIVLDAVAPQLIKPILRSLRPTYDYDYVKPLERTYKSLKSAVMAAQRFTNNNFEDGESHELCETEIKDAIDDDGGAPPWGAGMPWQPHGLRIAPAVWCGGGHGWRWRELAQRWRSLEQWRRRPGDALAARHESFTSGEQVASLRRLSSRYTCHLCNR